MKGVFLAGFGDVGREWPRDICHDKAVMTGKGYMGSQLLLYPLVGGELAQALGDLPAVLDREEPQVAVLLAEHEVVCLPYLFGGGSEGGEGIGEAGVRDFADNAVEVACVGSDFGHLGHVDVDLSIPRRHSTWLLSGGMDGVFVSWR